MTWGTARGMGDIPHPPSRGAPAATREPPSFQHFSGGSGAGIPLHIPVDPRLDVCTGYSTMRIRAYVYAMLAVAALLPATALAGTAVTASLSAPPGDVVAGSTIQINCWAEGSPSMGSPAPPSRSPSRSPAVRRAPRSSRARATTLQPGHGTTAASSRAPPPGRRRRRPVRSPRPAPASSRGPSAAPHDGVRHRDPHDRRRCGPPARDLRRERPGRGGRRRERRVRGRRDGSEHSREAAHVHLDRHGRHRHPGLGEPRARRVGRARDPRRVQAHGRRLERRGHRLGREVRERRARRLPGEPAGRRRQPAPARVGRRGWPLRGRRTAADHHHRDRSRSSPRAARRAASRPSRSRRSR